MAPFEGSQITYTVGLSNLGSSDASAITVNAPLPAGLTFVSVTGPGTYVSGTGVWTLASLAVNGTATLTITATVNTGTAGSTLTGTASLQNSTPTDPNSGNNSASVMIFPQAAADLAVSLSVSNTMPIQGTQITYTVGLSNLGPDDASNIVVGTSLPGTGLTFVSSSAPSSFDPVMGIWQIPALSAGSSTSLTITVTVNQGTAGTTITNSAGREGSTPTDPNSGNDFASVSIFPKAAADLGVSLSASDLTPLEGSTITYTVRLDNFGPADVIQAMVSAPLPTGLTFVSSSGAGTYDPTSGIWDVPMLSAGASAILNITATVNSGTTGTTIVGVASIQPDSSGIRPVDPNPSNDAASIVLMPQGLADLGVTLAVSNATPFEGATITYTVSLSNAGPNDARSIIVSAPLPTGLTFVSFSGAGNYDPTTGLWTVSRLAAGSSAALVVTATVNSGTAGTTLNGIAKVLSVTPKDPNPDNNIDRVSLVPQSVPIQLPVKPASIVVTTSTTESLTDGAATLLVQALMPPTEMMKMRQQATVLPLLPIMSIAIDIEMARLRDSIMAAEMEFVQRVANSQANSAGRIDGIIFEDTNGDGFWSTDELPLEGMPVYLDLNNNGEFDESKPLTYTDDSGRFSFGGLVPGTYTVRLVPHRLFAISYPEGNRQEVSVSSEGSVTVKFGCKPMRSRSSQTSTVEMIPPANGNGTPGDPPPATGPSSEPGPGDGGGPGE
jgi:uncharacterized repeat protein (TIGR01451 family)